MTETSMTQTPAVAPAAGGGALALPPLAGVVLAEILDALPQRLRKRLDASLERARAWQVQEGADEGDARGVIVRVDEETAVTVTARGGAVRAADDVHCDCLLAPGCLHRAAVATLAPILDESATATASSVPAIDDATSQSTTTSSDSADAAPESGTAAATAVSPGAGPPAAASGAPTSAPTTTTPVPATTSAAASAAEATAQPLTAAERSAGTALWAAGTAVLESGLVGSSVFTEAELRRAAHGSRALGLHRASTAATRVGNELRAARERRDDHSLPRLTADLRELLLVARTLRLDQDPAHADALRGISRRAYGQSGGMRLYGLFAEPIVARSGHAGVVTYLVDDAGRLWSTATVTPGGANLVFPAYNAAAGIGGTVQSHRELSRGGLFASGVSASAEGRLSGSTATRAAKAPGAAWTEPPIAALFEVPFAEQVERALRADADGPAGSAGNSGSAEQTDGASERRVGDDLVFATVRVIAATPRGVLVRLSSGEIAQCVSPISGHRLPFRRNLAAIAAPGLELRIIARPDRLRPATLLLLAANPLHCATPPAQTTNPAEEDTRQPEEQTPDIADDPAGKPVELAVPRAWQGLVNLGLDPLPSAAVSASGRPQNATDDPDGDDDEQQDTSTDTASSNPSTATPIPLHALTSRLEQAVAGGRAVTASADPRRDIARLSRAALHHAAHALKTLDRESVPRRDAFSRPIADDGYYEAWLAAAVYESAAGRELVVRHWLRACGTAEFTGV